MSTFVAPIPAAAVMQRVTPSAPAPKDPALRFGGDNIHWIGLPAGVQIFAFATGCIARASGATDGIPGFPALAWTAFQLTPLPQMDKTAFKNIAAGLPVQYVLVTGAAGASPAANDVLNCGQALITAPAGPGSTAFLGFAFQDRLCRDPLSAAEAIDASAACDASWTDYANALAALPHARNLRILDHRGAPLSGIAVTVQVDGGPQQNINIAPGDDGDTGVAIPAASVATVSLPGGNAIIGAGDADLGVFQGSLALPAGKRLAQVLNAADWLAQPDAGVSLPRWHAGSHVEPIQDGTPYFKRLVADMRRAKGGGAVQIAGWAVVKGSLEDSSVDWPLDPNDAASTILGLVNELRAGGADIRFLLNRFLQFDSPTLDDFPELLPILYAIYAGLGPLDGIAHMTTDPAGYVVGGIAVTALTVVLASGITLDILKKIAETSQPLKDELDKIDATIATWTPYPSAFGDNPLVAPGPYKILLHNIDDFSHIGVYHQKHVTIRPAAGPPIAYMGGIDINSDRPDTPLHRARHPFHDLQLRITGPAVESVIRTYQERATVHGGPHPINPDPVAAITDSPHLVQIARTYYKPVSKPGPFNSFAPDGESTPIRTIIKAIGNAKDFIYIEDQYFTPPDAYIDALVAAAAPARGVRKLMITIPFATDQPYGQVRRAQILATLSTAWGERLLVGAPLRRFLHEVPALTTNLGRLSLAAPLGAADSTASLQPPGRVPAPPFWAFIGGELVLVHALFGAATSTKQDVEIVRAPGPTGWGAQSIAHPKDEPVLAVQLPGIYVHAKMMIIDDIFLFAGSSNLNRRGFYHDGELDCFSIPQHLLGDPKNPARVLRSRLMAEHLGLSTEMGQTLFSDPHSAFHYFAERSWYEQSRWRRLDFFGSLPPDVPIAAAGSAAMFALQILIGAARDAAKPDVWPLLADPTSGLDPSSSKGPDYP